MYNLIKNIAKIFITKKSGEDFILYELFGSIPLRKVIFDNLYVKKYFLGFEYKTVININKLQESNQNILDKINEINQSLYNQLYSNDFRIHLSQIASHTNAVTATHQKTFNNYKNYHQNQNIVLVATGPSLNKYLPIKNAMHVGVNKAFQYEKVKFDYLFAQDYRAVKDYISAFCNYSKTHNKFFGIEEYYENYLDCVIPFDISNYYSIQRYALTHSINPFCPYTVDISSNPLVNGHSIVFPAMQFILYTNPKRIYLVGCDCSSSGHFDNIEKGNSCEHLIDGWQKLKEFAQIYYPDTEIISFNPVGLKGMFKDNYTS